MGVIELFGTLQKNNITASAIKIDIKDKLPMTHFLVDFNSIIHNTYQPILKEINIIFEMLFKNAYEGVSLPHRSALEFAEKYDVKDYYDQIVGAKMNKDDILKFTKEYFSSSKMDDIVLTQLVKRFLAILKQYATDELEMILIAIDGVPAKAKMIEQRQRRYMGAIEVAMKDIIFEQYTDMLKESYLYEYYRGKINWSSAVITPGTDFMDRVSKIFKSDSFIEKVKKYCGGIKKVQVSDMYEVGEGEKKLINYLKLKGTSKGKYTFYSPDADMILLTLLLDVNYLNILRYSAEKDNHDLIDLIMLRENMEYYVTKKISGKKKVSGKQILYDLVCISSIFGNDFVPKIESLNVKFRLKNIIDHYIDVMVNSSNHLCTTNGNKFILNISFLLEMFKTLLPIEQEFIKDNLLYQKFYNFTEIKDAFAYVEIDDNNIHQEISEFKRRVNEMRQTISNGRSVDGYIKDEQFMFTLRRTLNMGVNLDHLNNTEFVAYLLKYLDKKEFPKIRLDVKYNEKKSSDYYHKKELESKKNSYEKEIYKMNKMIDEYGDRFSAYPIDLTAPRISDFYRNYFHIKEYDYFSKLNKSVSSIVYDYFEGLYWVFDYYYNNNEYINLWAYVHEKAPLLRDICNISGEEIQQCIKVVEGTKYHVTPDKFFNTVELFMYVTPISDKIYSILPEEYHKCYREAIDKFANFFINPKKIGKDILSLSTDYLEYSPIDCRSASYLNKCVLKLLVRPSMEFDQEYLRFIRKCGIKATDNKLVRKLTNQVVEF